MGADLLLNSALVNALGWTLVHFFWQGCLIGFVFWLICFLSPKHASTLRYWTGLAGMLLSLLVMILTFSLSFAPEARFVLEADTASAVNPFLVLSGSLPGAWGLLESGIEPALPWVVCLWLLGVLISSARTLKDWWGVNRLVNQGVFATEAQLQLVLERLKADLGVQLAVRLLASAKVAVPITVGWLRPVILMPVSVLTRLPQDQLEMILAHELGHIHRFDYLVNLLQVALETLLFYHPAIGWMSRRVREEREHRCDELVVRTCGKPATYARALTNLEVLRVPAAATAVSATGGNLLARIKFIIDDRSPGRGSTVVQFVLAAIAGLAVVLGAQQGYSLSSELNRVAYSAQLQVSDVEWTTWGRSREAWGRGVQDYAQSKQKEQLAVLRNESLFLSQVAEPAADFIVANEIPALKEGIIGSFNEELSQVEEVKSLLESTAQPEAVVDADLVQLEKKTDPVAQFRQPASLASIEMLPLDDQPLAPTHEDNLAATGSLERDKAVAVEITPVKSRLPNYPWRARRKGIEGFVALEFSVDQQGKVTDVEVLDAMPEGVFEKAAQKALSRWTFEAGAVGSSRFKQIFDFALKDIEPIPPSRRTCGTTGSRTCAKISRGISIVWVNASTKRINEMALN